MIRILEQTMDILVGGMEGAAAGTPVYYPHNFWTLTRCCFTATNMAAAPDIRATLFNPTYHPLPTPIEISSEINDEEEETISDIEEEEPLNSASTSSQKPSKVTYKAVESDFDRFVPIVSYFSHCKDLRLHLKTLWTEYREGQLDLEVSVLSQQTKECS